MTDLFALTMAGSTVCAGIGLYLCFLSIQQRKLALRQKALEMRSES